MENTYTENQVNEKIEEAKKQMYNDQILRFAKQMEQMVSNNFVTSQKKNIFAKKFNQETVNTYLSNPQKYYNELINLSTILTTISPLYASIVSYFPSISKFVPVIAPNILKYSDKNGTIDEERLKKDYIKLSGQLEVMNIQSQFTRILASMMISDVFYGYEVSDNNTSYFMKLEEEYCQISSITDNCYNFMFNFAFFDKNNKLKNLDVELVDTYPPEFRQKYNLYLNDKTNYKWQELDPQKTICMKYTDVPFVFPPFANLYGDLSALESYKNNAKTKDDNSVYKLLGLKIPLLSGADKEDSLAVSTETAMAFYNMVNSSLPNSVGTFLTPLEATAYDFNSSETSEKNKILDAEKSLFLATSISPINFGYANTSTGLNSSNLVDSGKVFNVYRKFESWLNRWIKYNFGGKFTIQLLDVTIFNHADTLKNYQSLAQYGVPCKLHLTALAGVTPLKERGLVALENVLGIHEEWKPLQSSFTTSGDSSEESGRPEETDSELGDSGEATRDNDSNANKE